MWNYSYLRKKRKTELILSCVYIYLNILFFFFCIMLSIFMNSKFMYCYIMSRYWHYLDFNLREHVLPILLFLFLSVRLWEEKERRLTSACPGFSRADCPEKDVSQSRAPLRVFSGWILPCQLPQWHGGKESASRWRPRFIPGVGKIPWRRKWQPTPVMLPEESHGHKSPGGCSPWSHKE